MVYVCCSNILHLERVSLTRGQQVDLDEPYGEELVAAGRALVPFDRVDFDIDDSDECATKLAAAHAQYRSDLLENLGKERK